MTRILANNEHGQIIFNSYSELKAFFEKTDWEIRNAENNGWPIKNINTGELFWIDKLFSEEDLYKCEKENTR